MKTEDFKDYACVAKQIKYKNVPFFQKYQVLSLHEHCMRSKNIVSELRNCQMTHYQTKATICLFIFTVKRVVL